MLPSPPLVRVLRDRYTPRDTIQASRFIAFLQLEAQIPTDSYVFVWSNVKHPPNLRELVRSIAPTLFCSKEAARLDSLIDIIKRTQRPMAEEEAKSLLKYGDIRAIPASSLKGAIRSRLEYKLKPVKKNSGWFSLSCYAIQGDEPIVERHRRFWGEEVTWPREGPCRPEQGDLVCIVCDLFGAPSLTGRVSFSDALLTSGDVEHLSDLHIEAFRPGSSLTLSVLAHNASWEELGLLFTAMELSTRSPILIGFKKYFYNKLFGETYRQRYFFGMLKFSLKGVTLLDRRMSRNQMEVTQALDKAMAELQKSKYHQYLDMQKGALR